MTLHFASLDVWKTTNAMTAFCIIRCLENALQPQTQLAPQQNSQPTPSEPQITPAPILRKMNEIPCGEFQYRGDVTTLGARSTTWMEKFQLVCDRKRTEGSRHHQSTASYYYWATRRWRYTAVRKNRTIQTRWQK